MILRQINFARLKPKRRLVLWFGSLGLLFWLISKYSATNNWLTKLRDHPPVYQKQAEVLLRTNQGLGPTFSVIDKKRNRAFVLLPKRECFEPFDQDAFAQRKSLVAVLDLSSNQVVKTIPLELNLFGAALSPDGQWLYVANSFDDRITIINAETLQVNQTLPVGKNPISIGNNTCQSSYHYKPQHITFSRDGKFAYVTNSKGGAISVFDTTAQKLVKRIPTADPKLVAQNAFHGSSWGIAAHPTRDLVYVAEKISGGIDIINTRHNTKVGQIDLQPTVLALGLAVSPDGKHLWIADSFSGSVVIVNTQTEAEETRIFISDKSGEKPGWISFSDNGRWAYIAPEAGNTISVVDTRNFAVVDQVETTGTPFMAVEHQGKLLLTTRSSDSLQIYE